MRQGGIEATQDLMSIKMIKSAQQRPLGAVGASAFLHPNPHLTDCGAEKFYSQWDNGGFKPVSVAPRQQKPATKQAPDISAKLQNQPL